jgi:hypothetical protein
VLGADGDVLPGFDEDAGGEDAGGDDAGGEDAGGEDAGGDDAGGEEAGGDDAGGEDAGGEEAGGDDAGGEDAGGLLDLDDLVGCADDGGGEDGEETIGVGAMDVLEALDRAGLRYTFGETGAVAEGAAEDDVRGLAAGSDTEAGVVATAPAPACGWRWLAAGVRLAPISAKAATAEPATSAPVRHAEARVREMRCRPGPPVPARGGGPERGGLSERF